MSKLNDKAKVCVNKADKKKQKKLLRKLRMCIFPSAACSVRFASARCAFVAYASCIHLYILHRVSGTEFEIYRCFLLVLLPCDVLHGESCEKTQRYVS